MIEIMMNLPLVPLVVMTILVAACLVWVSKRGTHTPARVTLLGLTLLSIGGVIVITLLRFKLPVDPLAALRWQPDGALRFVSDFASSEEIWLNVLLFVPACLFATLYTARPSLVAPIGVATSILAECTQGAFSTGVPDLSDVLANSIGSTLGTLLGCAVLFRSGEHRNRRVAVPAAVLAALLIAAAASVPVAAGLYQSTYERAVEHNLRSVDYNAMETMKSSTGEDITHVWQAGYNFADGNKWNPREAVVRWPSSFMFVKQCVIAIWRPSGMKVQGGSGAICEQQWV